MTHPDRSEADLRLAHAFAVDAPPPRDPGFTLQVMAKVSRRKLAFDVVRAALGTAFGTMLLWALWPVLKSAFDPIAFETWQALGPALVVLTVVGSLLALERTSTRFDRAM
ncbi:MAG TPA: hypothetical protein VGL66_07140 [Caulobacteraceae bacterium]|jgi:hypothetical protein